MSEDPNNTLRRSVKALQKDVYEGKDKRRFRIEPLKWLPLVGVCIAGLTGYVQTQSDVEYLKRDVAKLENIVEYLRNKQ